MDQEFRALPDFVKTSPDDYLFTPKRGTAAGKNQPITSVGVWRLIKKLLKRAGLDTDRSPHPFRRAILSRLMEDFSADQIAREVSFHSALKTLNIYRVGTDKKLTENPTLAIIYEK